MRSVQTKNSRTLHKYEDTPPSIKAAQAHNLVIRNDWKDFIAPNDVAESVVMARANDVLSILAEDEGPVDKVYSIVILSTDQPIDEGPEIDWVQT